MTAVKVAKDVSSRDDGKRKSEKDFGPESEEEERIGGTETLKRWIGEAIFILNVIAK